MPAIPRSKARWARFRGPVVLVQTEQDVDTLDIPIDAPVAYVTQTTLSVDDTSEHHRGADQRRFTDIPGPETSDICYATQNRQSAVRELASWSTSFWWSERRTAPIPTACAKSASEVGIPSYLIADGSELEPEWVEDVDDGRHHRRAPRRRKCWSTT